MQPQTWNTNREQIAPGRFRSDVRGKWINCLDAGGWKPISDQFVSDSGKYLAAQIPGQFSVPVMANGAVDFEVSQRWNVFDKRTIDDPAMVLEFSAENVSPVDGIMNGNRVDYLNAFADGMDLRYEVIHGRGPRVSRQVVFRSNPSGSSEFVEVAWRMRSSNAFAYAINPNGKPRTEGAFVRPWTGKTNDQVTAASGQPLAIRYGTSPGDASLMRGSGVKPAKAWYDKPDGERVEKFISVRYLVTASDTVVATKLIPRAFVAEGLAAGAAEVVSDDTSTFYPDPSVEVTSVDGFVSYFRGSGMTWAEVQSQATSNGGDDNGSYLYIWLRADSLTDKYDDIDRSLAGFDTSSIDDTHAIDSGTLRVNPFIGISSTLGSYDLSLVSSSPASNTAVVSGDIDSFGSIKLATDMANATWTAGTGNQTFTLNAAGLTHIDNTGVTNFGIRFEPDAANVEPTWITGKQLKVGLKSAETFGTGDDPQLVVEHSVSGSAIPIFAKHYQQLRS